MLTHIFKNLEALLDGQTSLKFTYFDELSLGRVGDETARPTHQQSERDPRMNFKRSCTKMSLFRNSLVSNSCYKPFAIGWLHGREPSWYFSEAHYLVNRFPWSSSSVSHLLVSSIVQVLRPLDMFSWEWTPLFESLHVSMFWWCFEFFQWWKPFYIKRFIDAFSSLYKSFWITLIMLILCFLKILLFLCLE